MKSSANFKIDPKLAALLGENYRSIELAIKELVDNSFDADAENVNIVLPEPFTNASIIVEDNGTGMTENEIRNEYLKIANSRFSRKGERTAGKKRLVKGRKGIGKFAGLMVAEVMEVVAKARGVQTTLTISKTDLAKANYDLDKIDLPIETEACPEEETGTYIRLSGINDNFSFPNPEKLRQVLVLEYGRVNDFEILVNETTVDIEDIPGKTFVRNLQLPSAGDVQVRYTIADQKKAVRQAGLVVKVRGKAIGQPQLFGLEQEEGIPKQLQQRIVGEVVADKLEQDVTADWGAIIENSISYQEIAESLRPELERSFEEALTEEVQLARGRLQRQISKRLNRLPDYKQDSAKKALDNVMLKFFGENEERTGAVVGLVLDTFEQDGCSLALESISKSKRSTSKFSDALAEYGQLEHALQIQQANYRLEAISHFRRFIFDPKTTETQIQHAFEHNLWLLAPHYPTLSTNETLQNIATSLLNRRQDVDRPHLLFTRSYPDSFLVLQIKTGNSKLSDKDAALAKEYRDGLYYYFPNKKIEIAVLGGACKIGTTKRSVQDGFQFITYENLFEAAQTQQEWILSDWKKK